MKELYKNKIVEIMKEEYGIDTYEGVVALTKERVEILLECDDIDEHFLEYDKSKELLLAEVVMYGECLLGKGDDFADMDYKECVTAVRKELYLLRACEANEQKLKELNAELKRACEANEQKLKELNAELKLFTDIEVQSIDEFMEYLRNAPRKLETISDLYYVLGGLAVIEGTRITARYDGNIDMEILAVHNWTFGGIYIIKNDDIEICKELNFIIKRFENWAK